MPIIFRSILSENPIATSEDPRDEQLRKHFSDFSTTSANNMFIRPLFSRKPSSDCLQCFIKVAFKIISIAGYLYSSRYVKLFIVWNRKKFVRYNVNGTVVINLTFFASFAKEIPYEDKFSRGFNFVNARFEIFRVDLTSRINTFERFRLDLFSRRRNL